jgi:pimeloyl-ACP methyl ester carboxylesterase
MSQLSQSAATPTERRFHMDDGVELVADAWGDPTNPPAILLHGGGQTRNAWKRTAAVLAQHGYHAITVDQRGHGDSSWSPDANYRFGHYAADVGALARQFAIKPVLIGASLGGMSSIIAEGEAERSIASALVLVDIAPGADPEGKGKILGFMGSRADTGFASLEEAAEVIAAYLPHRPRPKSLEGLRKNLRLGSDGRYRWHYDPAFVRVQFDELDRGDARLTAAARRLQVPVLLVRGGSSELVSEDLARAFVGMVPNAAYVDVHGARHMVAGDENDPFTEVVLDFIGTLDRRRL